MQASQTPEQLLEEAGPSSSQPEQPGRILYVGHLPHGFYEDQLKGFFSQFGVVTRVRVSRNKRTGKSKHYAFVEFYQAEVAAIAAEAMDGYMMFAQKLKVEVVPRSRQHPSLMRGSKKPFKVMPRGQWQAAEHNACRTSQQQAARRARLVARDSKRLSKIRAAGIEYDYQSLESFAAPEPQHVTFDENQEESMQNP
ncbi:hypothetical protein WJX74_004423 [Apatococcus lobatus]|uniref:RRM domain-containing protein n=1 Tax=Apatococcus lobatus TaxID=904363 RepID=A0AAW1QCA5_9CHLO